jgi:uncharacterized protein (DUF2147 family)
MKTTRTLAWVAGLAGATALLAGAAIADDAPSAAGFWITPDHGAVVNIVPCDSGMCGYIVGLRTDHAPGDVPRDVKNHDPAKRNEPTCGLMMMGSLKPAAGTPGKWEGGWVYDPDSGDTYTAQMQLDGANTLNLRGYLGISLFGRTQTWTRETGETKNRCTKPPA